MFRFKNALGLRVYRFRRVSNHTLALGWHGFWSLGFRGLGLRVEGFAVAFKDNLWRWRGMHWRSEGTNR